MSLKLPVDFDCYVQTTMTKTGLLIHLCYVCPDCDEAERTLILQGLHCTRTICARHYQEDLERKGFS